MKVGDYVRTDKGEIGKLEELKLDYTKGKRLVTYYTYREVEENFIIFDNTNITQRFVDGSCYYLTDDELKNVEESIIKSSPDIIDLIEVGDLIRIEYYSLRYEERVTRLFEVAFKDKKYINLNNSKCDFMLIDGDFNKSDKELEPIIKSIVTKEQFSCMEYKIGE